MRGSRWWTRTAVRLPLLLVLLGVVAYYGVPRIIHSGSASARGACPLAPSAEKLPPSSLLSLFTRSGARSLVGDGTLDVQGRQEPGAAWNDLPPDAPAWGGQLIDAGYELRWWSSTQDHDGVSMFVFPAQAEAERYVRTAVSTSCRNGAAAYRLPEPVGGRALVWTNPVGVRQADVFFARGRTVYRAADVLPDSYEQGAAAFDDHDRVNTVVALACQLKAAGCVPPRQSATLSWGGYSALLGLLVVATHLDRGSLAAAATQLAPHCLDLTRYADAQARVIETGCKIDVHYLSDYAGTTTCRRPGFVSCEKAYLDALAGDLARLSWVDQELASALSAGTCKANSAAGASLDAREAHALLLFADGLAGNDPRLTQIARGERRALDNAVRWQDQETLTHLNFCNPSPTAARHSDSL